MDLLQLEFVRAVAREGTISAAAARLHRVPSNLTTRIKQLESELGIELFIREKSRLRLSSTGHTFLGYAEQMLALAEDVRRLGSGDEPRGLFTLGSLESTAAVRLPALLARFHHSYPRVELDLSTGVGGELADAVLQGRLSAAFVEGPPHQRELDGVAVFEEQLVVIAAQNAPPIRRARDVAGRNIYAFRPNCSYRRHFEDWFASDGVTPGHVFELESYHGMLACVTVGAGLALMPRSMLEAMPGHRNVRTHALQGEFGRMSIWLVWRRGHMPTNLAAFIALMKAELAKAG